MEGIVLEDRSSTYRIIISTIFAWHLSHLQNAADCYEKLSKMEHKKHPSQRLENFWKENKLALSIVYELIP